jgi:hypothetical protein
LILLHVSDVMEARTANFVRKRPDNSYEMMKIAYLHYHLKPGGVTTVIRQQVERLTGAGQALVLTGEPPPGTFPCTVKTVPGLGYRGTYPEPLSLTALADGVIQAIESVWPPGCDLLHIHNPTLAKNPHLLDLLAMLRMRGLKLFLQIHDFAEDGRPHAFFSGAYPKDCHWGVINSRDHAILKKAGLTDAGLHRIFNMVTPLPASDSPIPQAPRVLYPIRAIRRKNIGEALLLSLFFEKGMHLAVTLPPNSPADQASYAGWKTLARAIHLPVVFEVGLGSDFARLVRESDSLITTSITEGFGFSFLEPWTAGKRLWGRLLPDICADFIRNGIGLGHLYRRIDIPLPWIGRNRFLDEFRAAMEHSATRFGHRLPPGPIDATVDAMGDSGTVDFGQLHEKHQKQVIHRVSASAADAFRLKDLNPTLAEPARFKNDASLIRANREIVMDRYGAVRYQKNLLNIYGKVISRPVHHAVDKSALLAEFLRPETFSMLKWCDYED